MKPYYASDNATLWLGDCREILPRLERDSADLLLTDPPYGVRWRSNDRKERLDFIIGDEDTQAAVDGVRLALEVLRNKRHIYVFGRYDFSSLMVCSQVELIWDKVSLNGGDLDLPWANQHEYIQFMCQQNRPSQKETGRGNLTARLRQGTVLRCQRHTRGHDHPTEKPVALLRQLIESSSCIGDLVLDPFAGVGSTLEAALVEGRRAVGIEIHEPYAEKAARRLQRVENGLRSLFSEVLA